MELKDKIKYLEEMAQHEGTELGEMLFTLCRLYNSYKSYFSEDFKTQLGKEIDKQYKDCKENFILTEHTEKREVSFKTLERR